MADAKKEKKKYRILCWGACKHPGAGPCGINYPPDRRAEEGEIVDDIPVSAVRYLTENKYIEEVSDGNRT